MEEQNNLFGAEIMNEADVEALFGDDSPQEKEKGQVANPEDDNGRHFTGTDEQGNPIEITEADTDYLFGDSEPESVGKEETDNRSEGTNPDDGSAASPDNFFSSTAEAFRQEGVFTDVDDDKIKNCQSPEDLTELMQAEIDKRFNAQQKRVLDALNYGVAPNEIQQYESMIADLKSVKDDEIEANTQDGETLRRNIMMLDYMQQGMSEDRAKRFVDKSFETGTDVEDAKDALSNSLAKAQKSYEDLIANAKKEEEKKKLALQKQGEELRNDLYTKKTILGDFEVSETIRKKAYEVLTKPVYEDKESGMVLTELQKFEREHKMDFLKLMGIFYAMTDGFTNWKGMVEPSVKKETKKIWNELDRQFRSQKPSNGSMRFTGTTTKKDNDGWEPLL